MSALTSISTWIALATVIPGLVTVAVLHGALAIAAPRSLLRRYVVEVGGESVWVGTAIVVTVMVLTQAAGILLERFLVRRSKLGSTFEADGETHSVYEQYGKLYGLLARLGKDDDAHGHLQRAVGQYFLTNNTLVSFGIGIVATLVLAVGANGVGLTLPVVLYVLGLAACLVLSFFVAVVRFREMARSIWAVSDVGPTAAVGESGE